MHMRVLEYDACDVVSLSSMNRSGRRSCVSPDDSPGAAPCANKRRTRMCDPKIRKQYHCSMARL